VNTGSTVTRLMPFSSANSHAAFSKSTFDTPYACQQYRASTTTVSTDCLVCSLLKS
jgi:hypothetical protein